MGITGLTQLKDLQIWPIDLDNPEEIEHLLRLKRDIGTKLWKLGYDAEGYWSPEKLAYIEKNRRRKIVTQIQERDVSIAKMKNDELKDWLFKLEIQQRGKKADFIRQLEASMDSLQPSAPLSGMCND